MTSPHPTPLERARAALNDDNPGTAWLLAREALTAAPAEQQRPLLDLSIEALRSITSDLDEHGDANEHLYADGRYTTADYARFLDEARAARAALDQAPTPSLLPRFEGVVSFGPPRRLPGGNTLPLLTGAGLLGAEGHALLLRDLEGKTVRPLGVDSARAVALSPDGQGLAVGTARGEVTLVELASGARRFTWRGDSGWVTSLGFSPDGERLACGTEGRLTVLDARGEPLISREFGDGFMAPQLSVALWSLDGASLFTWFEGQLLHLDAATLETRAEHPCDEGAMLRAGPGRLLLAPYNAVALLDEATGAVVAKQALLERETRWASSRGVAVSPRGDLAAVLLVEAPEDGPSLAELQLWSLAPLARVASLPLPGFVSSESLSGGGVAFSPDAAVVAVVGQEETFLVPLLRSA